jgi:3-hydroxyisobutyrate dehydrogenase-like beta-hydroxyacid dehydrogenase
MTEDKAWPYPIRKVGVIGLGGIGRTLCRRLMREGDRAGLKKIAAFDADASVLESLGDTDIAACKSSAHLVDMVDLVLVCLPKRGDVAKIARAHEGLLDGVRHGQIVVDHGWSPLELTRQLATAVAARGAACSDAPISRSGNIDHAIDTGSLAFAVGGDKGPVDAVLPAFRVFARTVTHVGAIGAAQVTRQVGDLVTLQTFTALAEALATAHAFGVDGAMLFEALANGQGDNVGIGRHGLAEFVSAEGEAGGRGTTIADAGRRLRDTVELAASGSLSLSSAKTTLGLIDQAIENGLGDQDLTGLLRVMLPEPKKGTREARQPKTSPREPRQQASA